MSQDNEVIIGTGSTNFDPTAGIDKVMKEYEAKQAGTVSPAPSAPAAELVKPAEPVKLQVDPTGTTVPKAITEPPPPYKSVLPGDIAGKVAGDSTVAPASMPLDIAEEPPEVKSDPKAASAWAHLKRENKALQTQLETLKVQTTEAEQLRAELKNRPEVSLDEIAGLKKQIEDYENRLGQLDLAQTQGFKERYDDKLEVLANRAVSILRKTGKEDMEAQELAVKIFQAKGDTAQLQELVADEPPFVQNTLAQLALDVDDLVTKRNGALSDWKASKTILSDGAQRASTVETATAAVQSAKRASVALAQEGSWVFAESEDQDWNKQRDNLVHAGQQLLYEGNQDEIAKYVLEGLAASFYRKWFEITNQRTEQLSKELEARVRSKPGLGAVGVDDMPPAVKSKPVSAKSWLDEKFPGGLPV